VLAAVVGNGVTLFFPMLLLAALLPGLWGPLVTGALLQCIVLMHVLDDVVFKEPFGISIPPSPREVRNELIGLLAVFALILLVNYTIFR
jgi:hypothetical protein